jgi:2-oxoglutarate dehydrogenase E1 component
MESNPGPQPGINAWLEEELLQQYRHDRASVDAEWKNVFDHEAPPAGNGNGVEHVIATAPAVLVHDLAEPVWTGSDELMPLRGTAARIAENMALSASIHHSG